MNRPQSRDQRSIRHMSTIYDKNHIHRSECIKMTSAFTTKCHFWRTKSVLFAVRPVLTFRCIRRCYSKQAEAFSVTYKEYGDPNKVLKPSKTQLDVLGNGDILVKMLMAPVNPSDINMVEGTYFIKPTLPAVAGNEGVGEVIDVGSEVKSLKPGDWVIPEAAGFGTWRTFVTSNAGNFRKVANDIPVLSAATIAVNPCTAYRMLKDFGNLCPGDTIIQNSANSGVGKNVIQIANAWNLKTVNIVRNRDNIQELTDELKEIGADYVVTEEFSRTPEMKHLIKSLQQPPKLALNGVGGKSATELLRHLGQKGVMVTYGGMSRQPVVVPTGVFIFKQVSAVGYWNSQWNIDNKNNPEKDKMFHDLFDLIRKCKLIPPPCSLQHIRDYAAAVKSSMEGFQGRKTVLLLNDID